MISKRSLAYAKSFFEISPEEKTFKELECLSFLLEDKEVLSFLNSPLIDFQTKKTFLEDPLKSFSLEFRNFLFLLIEKRLLFLASEIKQAFKQVLNEKENKLEGEIFSPSLLDETTKSDLKKTLELFFKKDLSLKEAKNPDLLGGVFVRVGGYIFNDTLSFHLNQFKTQGE